MKPRKAVDSPELASIFILIVKGINYPQKIAETLNKRPPSIIEQLDKLRNEELIKAKKEKLLNKTIYEINWNKFEDIFLTVFISKLEETEKIHTDKLKNSIAHWILKPILPKKDTSSSIKNTKKILITNIHNLIKKGILREMIVSFFSNFSKYSLMSLNEAIKLFLKSCGDYYSKLIMLRINKNKKNFDIFENVFVDEDLDFFMRYCYFINSNNPSLDAFFDENIKLINNFKSFYIKRSLI